MNTNERKELKMLGILCEAHRIFVDHESFADTVVAGSFQLIKLIFPDDFMPDNSATIEGLLRARDALGDPYRNIITEHYFNGTKYVDIAKNQGGGLSPARISQIDSQAIRLLRVYARKFFFPARHKFLTKYAIFLDAIQSACPSKKDISVRELGFSTHTANALHRNGVTTASQMFFLSEEELLGLRNMGLVAVEEISKIKFNLLAGKI